MRSPALNAARSGLYFESDGRALSIPDGLIVSQVSNSQIVELLNLRNSSHDPYTLHTVELFLTIDPSKQSTGRAFEFVKVEPLLKAIVE